MKISKIDFPTEGFKQTPCTFAGVECVLIYPDDITVKFNEQNKIFRSSIWTLDGEPVSLGFRKFVNYGESPAFEPLNINDKGLSFPRKIDGSCLIVSNFRGELIMRTRQTTDARKMNNGEEIDYLIKKYPKAFCNEWLNNGFTCLYEWTTPSNIIVIKETSEPCLWLTGIVCHQDYSYISQNVLDTVATDLGVLRPETFKFNSFDEMQKAVEVFEGKEGIVVYSSDGQTLKKVKGLRYLQLHRMKSNLSSIENLVDFFLINKCSNKEELLQALIKYSDYEIAKYVEPYLQKIEDAYNQALKIVSCIDTLIPTLVGLPRKEQALKILSTDKAHSWAYFAKLDNKPLDNSSYKKLMMEYVK